MDKLRYEIEHTEEYYQKVSVALNALLESINTVQLEASDYELISGRATREVDQYIRQNLIKPLEDARSRIVSELQLSAETQPGVKRTVKGNMQRAMLFYKPLQDIFSALKEVPYLSSYHYEQLVRRHANAAEALTDFINQLELGRQRKQGKV